MADQSRAPLAVACYPLPCSYTPQNIHLHTNSGAKLKFSSCHYCSVMSQCAQFRRLWRTCAVFGKLLLLESFNFGNKPDKKHTSPCFIKRVWDYILYIDLFGVQRTKVFTKSASRKYIDIEYVNNKNMNTYFLNFKLTWPVCELLNATVWACKRQYRYNPINIRKLFF